MAPDRAPVRLAHDRRVGPWAVAAAVALLLALSVAVTPPAAAHPDDVKRPAGDLVRQAIALLATTPEGVGEVREKLEAAVVAKDQRGVDVELVEQAAQALEDGDPHAVRALLEQAVGAQPHVGLEDPAPIRETRPEATAAAPGEAPMPVPQAEEPVEGEGAVGGPATTPMPMARGAEPGAVLLADPLETRPRLDGGDWALLAASLAVGFTGLWLALRRRPAPAATSAEAAPDPEPQPTPAESATDREPRA